MTEIQETNLPGVGTRHDFACVSGDVVGVVTHHNGRRELLIYDRDDTDSVAETAAMTPREALVLAGILGGASVTERFDDVRAQIHGLAIDWVPLASDSRFVGRKLGDTAMRTATGASIVAIVRADGAIPAPTPDVVFEARDIVVVIGTEEGVNAAARLLGASDA